MFFFHNLQRDVELHPKFFGRQLRRAVEEQIYKEVRNHSAMLAQLYVCPPGTDSAIQLVLAFRIRQNICTQRLTLFNRWREPAPASMAMSLPW